MYIIRPIDKNGEFIGDVCKIGEHRKMLMNIYLRKYIQEI